MKPGDLLVLAEKARGWKRARGSEHWKLQKGDVIIVYEVHPNDMLVRSKFGMCYVNTCDVYYMEKPINETR
jgi:hypothetical protein